ncbi:hypothetical protein CK216_17720 [Mesorhizobium sp. WSM3876]|nr:hypothetical protein CK216_17720 [Mesorhizobium sp. WSM3876]
MGEMPGRAEGGAVLPASQVVAIILEPVSGSHTMSANAAFRRAPLWPAGHLPHEGGDQQLPR